MAQLVEQRIRNAQVVGSSPTISSTNKTDNFQKKTVGLVLFFRSFGILRVPVPQLGLLVGGEGAFGNVAVDLEFLMGRPKTGIQQDRIAAARGGEPFAHGHLRDAERGEDRHDHAAVGDDRRIMHTGTHHAVHDLAKTAAHAIREAAVALAVGRAGVGIALQPLLIGGVTLQLVGGLSLKIAEIAFPQFINDRARHGRINDRRGLHAAFQRRGKHVFRHRIGIRVLQIINLGGALFAEGFVGAAAVFRLQIALRGAVTDQMNAVGLHGLTALYF